MKIKGIIAVKLVLIIAFGFYYTCSLTNYFVNSRIPTGSEWIKSSIKYVEHIVEASRATGVNPALVAAIISVESNFKPDARSCAGAKGLMQINDITARYLKVKNIYDPRTNIHAGVSYLSELSEMFDNRTELVLAAYNAGPGAVKRFRGVPPYKETRKYVEKVMKMFHMYKAHPELSRYI